ncbi:hypothetical protein PCAR4_1210002 [Paraburkholderia caribensis]|nr:hypothetical protein PCAR4_1210002 [Paraburkholderia caribensis]
MCRFAITRKHTGRRNATALHTQRPKQISIAHQNVYTFNVNMVHILYMAAYFSKEPFARSALLLCLDDGAKADTAAPTRLASVGFLR